MAIGYMAERSQRRPGRTADPFREVPAALILSQPMFHKWCCFAACGTLTESRAVGSNWACAALVNERKGSGRGFHVVSAEPLDPKSARFNQVVNLSVKMATTTEPFPRWS
jgi:hypothetical protein